MNITMRERPYTRATSYAFLFGEFVATRNPGLVMDEEIIQAADMQARQGLGDRDGASLMNQEGFQADVLAGYRSVV